MASVDKGMREKIKELRDLVGGSWTSFNFSVVEDDDGVSYVIQASDRSGNSSNSNIRLMKGQTADPDAIPAVDAVKKPKA
jgi:hypothetical protein